MKKEYVIFGAIVAVAVYAISRLRQPVPGVVSSLVPVSVGGTGTAYDSRDPARVSAFTALASLAQGESQRASRESELAAGLEAERIRAGAQRDALALGGDIERARLAVQRELGLAGIDASTQQRRLDAETQLAAIELMGQQAAQQGMTAGVLNAIAAALGALRPQQSRQGGGMSGGGGQSPQQYPQQQRPRFPRVPVPNVGPYTPPFVPGWPTPNVPGGFDDYYEPPFVDLPFFPSNWGFDWLPDYDLPGPSGGYIPEGEGDLYIPGIDPPNTDFNWWDWPTGNESGGGDSWWTGGGGAVEDWEGSWGWYDDYFWGEEFAA